MPVCPCLLHVGVLLKLILALSMHTVHLATSFGWGKGGNVTSAGWQVTLCDPAWHVSSRSVEACC